MARNFFISAARSNPGHRSPRHAPARAGRAVQRAEGRDDGGGEFGIVDVALQTRMSCRFAGLAHGLLERAEQRRVGVRILERLPRRIERGDAALGQEEAHRPVHAVEALADPAADRARSLPRVVRISVTCGLWTCSCAALVALGASCRARRN